MPNTRSSHTEPPKPMTTFSVHTKQTTISESTKTSTPNQPWGKFPEKTDKIIIEDPKKVKVVNPNPHSIICNPEPKASFVLDTPHPHSQQLHSPDICSSPEKSFQDVDESHLSDSTSTTTNLNETCSLDTSCDHLLRLDSPSLSSELQDNSIVENTETESVPDSEALLQLDSTSVSSQDTSSSKIEFVSESEGQLDNANLSPTDISLEHHDYELFLLQKEIDAPYDNLSHQENHVCEKQGQDEVFIHATNLSHNFALPQFMADTNVKT